jgi:hypothetical protein
MRPSIRTTSSACRGASSARQRFDAGKGPSACRRTPLRQPLKDRARPSAFATDAGQVQVASGATSGL